MKKVIKALLAKPFIISIHEDGFEIGIVPLLVISYFLFF